MVNETRIGGYIVREDRSEELAHVQLPTGGVAVLRGDDYRALHVRVYPTLTVAVSVAESALDGFLIERGVRVR